LRFTRRQENNERKAYSRNLVHEKWGFGGKMSRASSLEGAV
jgi:hypothetical protein